MEKKSFIEKLLVLLANEDVLSVAREVNELRTRFEDFCIEEDRKKQVAFLEAHPDYGAVLSFAKIIDEEGQDFQVGDLIHLVDDEYVKLNENNQLLKAKVTKYNKVLRKAK
jgi:2-oxo-4-hydroxy-4-carboxy--5-ureidoimidazoline (OHCU) decarboxylase